MTQPYRPPDYHEVTLRTTSAKAAATSGEKQQAAGVFGPWFTAGYLFCFAEPDQWANPGENRFIIDLQGLFLDIGTPWALSADVTELIPPNYPHIGDAIFFTRGVMLNQPNQLAIVSFFMDWDFSLPVAIMMNIGGTAHPE
jgi:hypothetical protein